MAAANPFTLVPAGTFPLNLDAAIRDDGNNKKRKRQSAPVIGLRHNFKPNSITPSTTGALHTENGSRQVRYKLPSGGSQVFDGREEVAKMRDCVMVWDESSKSFTLYPISSTIHLTLNRTASTSKALSIDGRSASVSSSTSSTSIPLNAIAGHESREVSGKSRKSISAEEHVSVPERPTRSGKSIAIAKKTLSQKPTKAASTISSAPIAHAAIPTMSPSKTSKNAKASKGKSKLNAKSISSSGNAKGRRGKTASSPISETTGRGSIGGGLGAGKFKSAEIIEDSDEEEAAYDETHVHERSNTAGGRDTGHEGEEEEVEIDDEFAKMMEDSLADNQVVQEEEEEEDSEDEYEEDDDDLGGATMVADPDGTEWI